jgi:hypothetical protein
VIQDTAVVDDDWLTAWLLLVMEDTAMVCVCFICEPSTNMGLGVGGIFDLCGCK